MPTESTKPTVVKLSFNIAQYQLDELKRLAACKGVSMTEVLRHAISLESFLQKEVADGGKIVVHRPNGEKRELVLVGM